MSIEPETPATEVRKQPNKPTRMMVLVEGVLSELAMMRNFFLLSLVSILLGTKANSTKHDANLLSKNCDPEP